MDAMISYMNQEKSIFVMLSVVDDAESKYQELKLLLKVLKLHEHLWIYPVCR